jgi:hypothetical protein
MRLAIGLEVASVYVSKASAVFEATTPVSSGRQGWKVELEFESEARSAFPLHAELAAEQRSHFVLQQKLVLVVATMVGVEFPPGPRHGSGVGAFEADLFRPSSPTSS